MHAVKVIREAKVKISLALLMGSLMVFMFAESVFAQVPKPTPVPPSGSNPQKLAPTDIPPDSALLGVLIFFAVLCVWLVAANFLVRQRTFIDQIDQPGGTQPEAKQVSILGTNGGSKS
jgi:hypothetical protein